ncbi:MAG: hypothetical protein ACQEXJ_11555 [Myxococcota bacterium]
MSGTLRTGTFALLLLGASLQAGCGKPCAKLEEKVCEEMDDERRCELMRDPDRREHLSREACERILKSLERR